MISPFALVSGPVRWPLEGVTHPELVASDEHGNAQRLTRHAWDSRLRP